MTEKKNQLAIVKKDVVDVVSAKVREFQASNELHLPANYSPENAMKSAFLVLQDTQNRDKKPVLTACSQNSIANSLLDMVVQGLNPAKKQCYFIAYGTTLSCQRSYFGTMAVARMVDPRIDDIVAEVVYEGDELTYEINRGKKEIVKHKQTLKNVDKSKIVAAYCSVYDKNGVVLKAEIMTMEQIKQAWRQSKMNPVDDNGDIKPGSTHGKFTADMAIKTVINRACKPIINASSDNHLLIERVKKAEETRDEADFEVEVAEQGNAEIIDIDTGEITDEPEVKEATGGPGF